MQGDCPSAVRLQPLAIVHLRDPGIFDQRIHNLMEIWADDSRVRASMDRNEMQRMSSELSQVGLEAQELDDFVEGSTRAPRELPFEIHGAAAF
ncbi:hypothetical protein AKJ16_DCAP22693 [Drosera capensis]